MSDLIKSDFSKRFQKIVSDLGGQNAAARHIGISQGGIYRLVSGGEPSLSTLKLIAEKTGQSLLWLASGDDDLPTNYQLIPLRDVFASAGGGAQNENENIIGTLPFPKAMVASWGRLISRVEAIRVRGDSMEPTIQEGDFILLDRADRELKEGRVYVFTAPDGLLLKRFQRHVDGSVMLVSDNQTYTALRLSPAEMSSLKIAGRAFWAGGLI